MQFDIAIVGTGAGGMPAAWYLTNKGYKVICIEKGVEFDINEYTSLEDGGEIYKNEKLSTDMAKREEYYRVNNSNSPIQIHNYSGVGGSTLMHSCMWPRLKRDDFMMRTKYGIAEDWPITIDDLLPYYEMDTVITGVAGKAGNPLHPEYKPVMKEVPLGKQGELWKEIFESYGWDWWPSYAALNTESYDGREMDGYGWPSNMGPANTGKGSTNNTYYPKAKKQGLIVLEGHTMVGIEQKKNENNEIEVVGLKCRERNGRYKYIKAKKYILACGGIATPAILLSQNLCNSSGLVGKNLMLHPWGYVEGQLKENMDSNKGPQGCCVMSQHKAMHSEKENFKSGYTVQVIRGPLAGELAKHMVNLRLHRKGSKFMEEFMALYNKSIHAVVIADDFPEINNRVEAKKDDKKIEIDVIYTMSENSKKQLSDGINNLRKMMKGAGVIKTRGIAPVRNTGWHTLGTCRMAKDKTRGVVNRYGQTFDIKNLYISDASVFVTGGSVNPGATIQAISLYVASKIDEHWQR